MGRCCIAAFEELWGEGENQSPKNIMGGVTPHQFGRQFQGIGGVKPHSTTSQLTPCSSKFKRCENNGLVNRLHRLIRSEKHKASYRKKEFMALKYHPKRGTIVTANFDQGFKKPEMVKRRLCVVVSPPIKARRGLCTVVPLSTTPPNPEMAYHYELEIPFQLPAAWGHRTRWAKCDMICAVGWHRVDLLAMGKDRTGKRQYQMSTISNIHMAKIEDSIKAALGIQD